MTKIELQTVVLSEADKQKEILRVKSLIKTRYPDAEVDKLIIRFSRKKLKQVVVVGPKRGETRIALDDGSGLQKSFLNQTFVKKVLRPTAGSIISTKSAEIRKRQKELNEKRERELQEKPSLEDKK